MGAAASASAETSARAIEASVRARAREFTIPALLDVLHALGYRTTEIEYKSNQTAAHKASLIECIEFLTVPHKRVIITVNIGLLGVQSPLPSYFFRLMEQYDTDAMIDFIGFFDHGLLRSRFDALYPERDRAAFPDWEETKALNLKLLGLQSPSTMHWMFQRVFPELAVQAKRWVQRHTIETERVVLGDASLGEGCALGGAVTLAAGGIEITLYCEEAVTPAGAPWAREASRRLDEVILPLLRTVDLYLNVVLIFQDHKGWARLEKEHFLGFDPVYDGGKRQAERAQAVLLFSGETSA